MFKYKFKDQIQAQELKKEWKVEGGRTSWRTSSQIFNLFESQLKTLRNLEVYSLEYLKFGSPKTLLKS